MKLFYKTRLFKLLLMIFIIFCSVYASTITAEGYAKEAEKYDYQDPLAGAHVVYTHLIAERKPGQSISEGEKLGRVQELPDIVSQVGGDYIKGREFYNAGKFKEASAIFETLYQKYPDNMFVLFQYARANYMFDREKSFKLYKKLIDKINNYPLESVHDHVVDVWFIEANWKLATLYLDKEDYPNAILEMMKFYSAADLNDNPLLKEQLLSYLTEAYYYSNDRESALHFYYLTLAHNPENKYVKQFTELNSGMSN